MRLPTTGGYTRGEELANRIAILGVKNEQAAKLASQMEATKLAQAIMGIIKKGIKPSEPFAEGAVSTLSQANKNSALIQKVLDILSQSIKGPGKMNSTCPPDSIGDAYFAGRKCGCVFGSPTNPNFKLKLNGSAQSSWKGWKLVLRPGTSNSTSSRPRFDFIKEKYEGGKPMSNLAPKYLDKDLADTIIAIIHGKVSPKTVDTILTNVPQANVVNTIIATVKASLAGVNKSTLNTIAETATPANVNAAVTAAGAAAASGQTPKNIHAAVKASSSSNLVNRLMGLVTTSIKIPNTTKPIKNAEGRTGLGGFLQRLFKGRLKFPVLGSFVLDPSTYIPQFINGFPIQYSKLKGYFVVIGGKMIRVFQRGNKLVSQEGREAQPASAKQNAKNKIAQLLQTLSTLAEAAKKSAADYLKAVREARGASNANKANKAAAAAKARLAALEAEKKVVEALAELMALYKSLFNVNGTQSNVNINSNEVFDELYSNSFAKMSATARSKKLAELLKKYPVGSKARNIVKTRTLEEIRNAGQNSNAFVAQRRLQNLRTNIKPSLSMRYNQNLLRALGVEKDRALSNIRNERNERRGRDEYGKRGKDEYGKRGSDEYGRRGSGRRGYGNNYGLSRGGGYGNEGVRRRRSEGSSMGPSEYSNAAAAALPMNQKNAITNAGGVRPALNTVAAVPGGATEVAKAAEALNETNGNVSQAVNVKGVSPAAIQAVKKLGGPKSAVIVLHGLNTLSQKTSTIKRKAKSRRRKPTKIRIAELNRVINAVKKQKLISLTAHNVTKTHNIHPNDEKKKKYYKRVIKANILRTKFAKIVKKAAKK